MNLIQWWHNRRVQREQQREARRVQQEALQNQRYSVAVDFLNNSNNIQTHVFLNIAGRNLNQSDSDWWVTAREAACGKAWGIVRDGFEYPISGGGRTSIIPAHRILRAIYYDETPVSQ